jgi:phage-related tail protein
MSPDDKKSGTAVEPPKDAAALRAEIAEIRADLGDTVEALAAKADVKAQAHAKVDQTKEQLKEKAGQAKAQLEQTTGQLKAKAEVQTAQLRGKAEEQTVVLREKAGVAKEQARVRAEQGRGALARYSPWPQIAGASAAAMVLALIGGRAVRRRFLNRP